MEIEPMKTIPSVLLLAGLACGAAALAQAQTPQAASPSSTSSAPSMTKAEQIKQLKPATNFIELMQLLNTLHTQVLLTDPSFMEDDNILRLFGPGQIVKRQEPTARHQFKQFIPRADNPFQFTVRLMGVKTTPAYGSLIIGDFKNSLPLDHELIESHLIPGVRGSDPLHPLNPMTNEARNFATGRPLATHPKGYWVYPVNNTTANHDASLIVDLDRNAHVLKIDLTQREE
jgi:hypothetical protein